jgi:hypothetical protein
MTKQLFIFQGCKDTLIHKIIKAELHFFSKLFAPQKSKRMGQVPIRLQTSTKFLKF